MPASHAGAFATPHRRARLTVIDQTAEVAHLVLPDDEQPPEPARRPTWIYAALGALAGGVVVLLALEVTVSLSDPVMRGHLRGAAPIGAGVIIAVVACTYVLYRYLGRLHLGTRAVSRWFKQRAKVIDQRDAEWRARQIEIADEHRVLREGQDALAEGQRVLAEDVTLIGRAAAEQLAHLRNSVGKMRNDVVDLAEGIGYNSGSIRRVRQEIASLGGGQAALAEAVEHLAHIVRQMGDRQQRAMDGDQPGSDDVRQAIQRGEQGAEEGNVVALPNGVVYDMGKRRGRWEALQELGVDGESTS